MMNLQIVTPKIQFTLAMRVWSKTRRSSSVRAECANNEIPLKKLLRAPAARERVKRYSCGHCNDISATFGLFIAGSMRWYGAVLSEFSQLAWSGV